MILVESIFVGIWTLFIYFGLRPWLKGIPLWFVLGFCKHGLAGILGLHDAYCGYKGYKNDTLLLESFAEGGLFAFASLFVKEVWYSVFLFGVSIHLFFEITGIHANFKKIHCKK